MPPAASFLRTKCLTALSFITNFPIGDTTVLLVPIPTYVTSSYIALVGVKVFEDHRGK